MRNTFVLLLAVAGLATARLTTLESLARRQAASVPQYVLDNAPLCWLDTAEQYFPSDLNTHLADVSPYVNNTPIANAPTPLTLSNLDSLNAFGNNGKDVYLTANNGGVAAQPQPAFFHGTRPDPTTHSAPGAVIIVVPKANGVVDAFYFYFFSWDQGNFVLGQPTLEFGDHTGDWEHNMIRFTNGVPTAMWFSQHTQGQAFFFSTLEKDASGRPVNYIAKGTHANYAISGNHGHDIPGVNLPVGVLVDHTSKGTLWDPVAQALVYTFDEASNIFASVSGAPANWLNFNGAFGDKQLPDSDSRQKTLFGAKKYVDGPTGPNDKDLGRGNVCPSGNACVVLPVLLP